MFCLGLSGAWSLGFWDPSILLLSVLSKYFSGASVWLVMLVSSLQLLEILAGF